MESSRYKTSTAHSEPFIWIAREVNLPIKKALRRRSLKIRFAPLRLLRRWLNEVEIQSPEMARKICQTIPARCPFERTIRLFGRTILRIPPLCKLNPLYEEVVALRFRALSYLADECGEDVSCYC